MKGLKLTFGDNGASLVTDEYVEGAWTTVQNGMVNFATIQGTDRALPDKGTELFLKAVRNGAPTINVAIQYANFAAVDTLFFLREYDIEVDENSAEEVLLSISDFSINRLSLDAQFTMLSGETFGIENTNITTLGA